MFKDNSLESEHTHFFAVNSTNAMLENSIESYLFQILTSGPDKLNLEPIPLPMFGFIHAGLVHLWNPTTRRVALFPDPKLFGGNGTFPLTWVPFKKYFSGHQVSSNAIQNTSLVAIWMLIVLLIVFVVVGIVVKYILPRREKPINLC